MSEILKKILFPKDDSTVCYSTYDTRNKWIVDLCHERGELVLHMQDGKYITLSATSRKGAVCTHMVFLKDPIRDHKTLSALHTAGQEVEVSLVAEG
jgi:hypothetical protein